MKWKVCGRKRSCPDLKVLSRQSLGGTEEIRENLTYDSRSPGRNLNPGPPEYEGVLSNRDIRPLAIVYFLWILGFMGEYNILPL
jgi:hypothetical protein